MGIKERDAIFVVPRGLKLSVVSDYNFYNLAVWGDSLITITGNRGRVFSIKDDGSYEDIAHLAAQQGLSLAKIPSTEDMAGFLIGTGNTGPLNAAGNSTSPWANF